MKLMWITLWISACFSVLNANPLTLQINATKKAVPMVAEARKEEDPTFLCYCDDIGSLCVNNTCTTTGSCFVFLKNGHVTRTCSNDIYSANLYCKSKYGGDTIFCCTGNFCNKNITLHPPTPHTAQEKKELFNLPLFVAIPVICVLVLASLAYVGYRFCYKPRCKEKVKDKDKVPLNLQQKRLLEEEISSHPHQDHVSSGSGSGQPALVQRTAGKDCRLIEQIGQGRFGEVWKGVFKGDIVAVKIFTSLVENSWKQERDIYNMGLLRHDNILGFYASDTTARNSCTVHMIIVHYHHHGSLYDYLKLSDIDMEEMLTLALSSASGINYLHNEIRQGTGTNEKPYIAHRDIKSKNILVKSNGECCIGDFGYAITETEGWERTIYDLRVGTKRYMAPELLAETLNPRHFRAFLSVDLYAFGLILWEIARRTRPFSEEYQMPFWNVVPANPSFEDMKEVVVCQQMRPPIPNTWDSQPLMVEMEKLIRGCWAQNPSSRLSILRVKLNIANLRGQSEWTSKTEKMLSQFDGSSTNPTKAKVNDGLALTSTSSPIIT